MPLPAIRLILAFCLTQTFSGCKTAQPNQTRSETKSIGSPLELCVALRGNGHYISTHFGALARILEDYGHIDSMSGGSSSTVTMFYYESIRMNPAIQAASDAERPIKMALLFKSLFGYIHSLKDTPVGDSLLFTYKLFTDPRLQEIAGRKTSDFNKVAKDFAKIFSEPKFANIVNPNIIAMLHNKDQLNYVTYEYKVSQVQQAILDFGRFQAVDQRILFREGLLNFEWVTSTIGYIADLYAGTLPETQKLLSEFLDECGTNEVSAGHTWIEIGKTKPACHTKFSKTVRRFESEWAEVPARQSRRLSERVGAIIPFAISTGIIEGKDGVEKFLAAESRFKHGAEPKLRLDFAKDVRFGYWLHPAYASQIETNLAAYGDGKSAKFLALGNNPTWEHVLARSPAEPGLSRYVPISSERISVGGWSDLQPVQTLKAAGCSEIVYVTRRTEESTFIVGNKPIDGVRPMQGVSELLNLQEQERISIFDLNNSKSGFSVALAQADAVLCTDWNVCTDTEAAEMMDDAYNSEFVSANQKFIKMGKSTKAAVSPIIGCSDPARPQQVVFRPHNLKSDTYRCKAKR